MSTKQGTKYTSQNILNESYDTALGVLVVEELNYDPNGSVRKVVTEDLTTRIYRSGIYTYVAEATIASITSDPVWRISRIDTSGNELWADGDSSFDNIADDYLSISFS